MTKASPELSARLDKLAAARLPLDPGMAEFRDKLAAETPPEAVHWPLERQRSAWDAVCKAWQAPRPPGLSVYDLILRDRHAPLKLRVYRPEGADHRPGLLYFHGGGWVLGSLETHDDMCAEIAAGAGVVVAALDYRLAPENPFPAQCEDALAFFDWVMAEGAAHGIDTARLVAGGDSAGGQMTASLAIALRDRGVKALRGQVLVYPVLDADMQTDSYRRNGLSSALSREEMRYYLDAFLGPPDSPAHGNKLALPLLETDYAGLPPAFITAAAHDTLQDEAFIFAERLEAAGVPVKLRAEPALDHSYMRARHHSEPAYKSFRAIVGAVKALGYHGVPPED